jgi:hypothetical protein
VHFREAIRCDPRSAQAHTALAMADTALGHAYYDVEPSGRAYAEAKAALHRAVALGGEHAETLVILAVSGITTGTGRARKRRPAPANWRATALSSTSPARS